MEIQYTVLQVRFGLGGLGSLGNENGNCHKKYSALSIVVLSWHVMFTDWLDSECTGFFYCLFGKMCLQYIKIGTLRTFKDEVWIYQNLQGSDIKSLKYIQSFICLRFLLSFFFFLSFFLFLSFFFLSFLLSFFLSFLLSFFLSFFLFINFLSKKGSY